MGVSDKTQGGDPAQSGRDRWLVGLEPCSEWQNHQSEGLNPFLIDEPNCFGPQGQGRTMMSTIPQVVAVISFERLRSSSIY